MARLSVPGAAVGVIADGQWYAEGFGVTHVERPLPVTTDTLFQVGSTSKTFGAMAVLMLADEGKIDIEQPVRAYIPGFRLRSEEDASRVTVRHLLTHHGGWMADYFKDMGRGNDALALMVEKMAEAPQVVPAGFGFSYSNAGFNVLARIVEVVSGQGFETFIASRIFEPLEMSHSTYFADEAIVHRVAHGHFPGVNGPQPFAHWAIARSIAGSSGVISSVLDQLRYAAFQMGDGSGSGGQHVLREETLRAMQSAQAAAGSMCESDRLLLDDRLGWRACAGEARRRAEWAALVVRVHPVAGLCLHGPDELRQRPGDAGGGGRGVPQSVHGDGAGVARDRTFPARDCRGPRGGIPATAV
jgi:CubicO group peptidase (beta-lactamase class C family)